MLRYIGLPLAGLLLITGLSFAEPELTVEYPLGVPRVALVGDFARSQYTVWRAPSADGSFAQITNGSVLCLGRCFADDASAIPGNSYLYRFDLLLQDGTFVSYGPYPVTISTTLARRVAAAVLPNPGRGPTRVKLFLAGAGSDPAVAAEATLFDPQGRAVHTLHRGPLSRGVTFLEWDGHDASGRPLEPGLYFLRFSSSLGTTVSRVIRAQ